MSRSLGTHAVVVAAAPATAAVEPAAAARDEGAAVSKEVWMQDKLSAECVLCFRAFTMMLRRHHCRQCGVLVCSKCSSHKLLLDISGVPASADSSGKDSADMKMARVCDGCWGLSEAKIAEGGADGMAAAAAAAAAGVAPVADGWSGVDSARAQAALADPSLALPTLPPWTYMFLRSLPAPLPSPYASTSSCAELASALVPIGRLYVRVIRCVNLPASTSLLSACDAYVSVHCGGASHRTGIVTHSLNPHFDASFYFDVQHSLEDLVTFRIFDWDALGKDKHIAYLQLSLAQCKAAKQRTPVWFDIEHISLEAAKAGNMKSMKKNKVKQALKKKDKAALDEAHQSSASGAEEAAAAAAAAASSTEVRVARPRIQLELQYVSARAGEMSTHLLPADPTRPSPSIKQASTLIPPGKFAPLPKFDIDVLYRDLFRFLSLLSPLTSALMSIGPLTWFAVPWQSFLALCVIFGVCKWPWMFLVLLELLGLWGMARSLVRRIWAAETVRQAEFTRARREAVAAYALAQRKKDHVLFRGVHNLSNFLTGREDDAPDAVNQRAQSVFGKLNAMANPFHTDDSGNALDASSQASLNSVVTHTLNGLLVAAGMKENLLYYQLYLTWLCEMIEWFTDLVSWKDFQTTKTIAIALVVVLIYSIFCPQRYLIFLINFYIFTMWTPQCIWLFAAMGGLSKYMAGRHT